MRVIVVFLITFCSVFSNAQNDTLFNEANALYNQGNYLDAIEKYEAILKSNEHSAAVYFNLANTHYKLNNIAPSIYYFEKAKLLNPNDEDIKNNLVFAENMTVDAIDKVPEVGFSRIFNKLVNTYSADTWAKLAIAGVILFVLLFLLYHFTQVTIQKRISFVLSILAISFALFSVVMAFQKNNIESHKNPAIVFAQESRVKADPNKTSEEVFRLHEGTKVQVLETYDDWYKIEITDKTQGWIVAEDVRLLNNF